MKSIYLVPAVVAALMLSACGSYGVKEDEAGVGAVPVEGQELTPDTVTSGIGGEGATSNPTEVGGDAGALPPALVSPAGATSPLAPYELSRTVVYFDYDSVVVNEQGRQIVAEFAKYLAAHPAAKLRVEGHADERGTREYNIGLGERRAQAVQALLAAAGANEAQLLVTSYGEERPVAIGQSEESMAKNRRVELVR